MTLAPLTEERPGTHVIAAHSGAKEIVSGRPWQVWVFGSLFLLAMTTRVTADFLPEGYWVHLGGAAALWVLALLAWGIWLVPRVLRLPPPEGGESVRELPIVRQP